ncbi:entericidin EcnAB, partial [Sphingomonas sp.]|uniref:entericidin EcnAB n=1 Tax=Sphingomonas sp. TaxID=28214 RepID=UPI0035C809AA
MKKVHLGLAFAIAAMPLAACSERAQEQTSQAADAIGDDVASAGARAANATERAADDVSAAADRAGENIEQA